MPRVGGVVKCSFGIVLQDDGPQPQPDVNVILVEEAMLVLTDGVGQTNGVHRPFGCPFFDIGRPGLIDGEHKCPSHLLPVLLNMSECRVLSKRVLSLWYSGHLVTE